MHHYILSYDLKDSQSFNGTYRTEIINFLLNVGAHDIDSYVASTIYFTSPNDFEFVQQRLVTISEDIHFHVAQIRAAFLNMPIVNAWYDEAYKAEFDNERDRIIAERNG